MDNLDIDYKNARSIYMPFAADWHPSYFWAIDINSATMLLSMQVPQVPYTICSIGLDQTGKNHVENT